jgi:hypothetical protein
MQHRLPACVLRCHRATFLKFRRFPEMCKKIRVKSLRPPSHGLDAERQTHRSRVEHHQIDWLARSVSAMNRSNRFCQSLARRKCLPLPCAPDFQGNLPGSNIGGANHRVFMPVQGRIRGDSDFEDCYLGLAGHVTRVFISIPGPSCLEELRYRDMRIPSRRRRRRDHPQQGRSHNHFK